MMDKAEGNASPSIINLPFGLHQVHQPATTAIASQLSLRAALPDLENLFGDATHKVQSITQTDTLASQWSTPTGTNGLYQQPPSILPKPQTTSTDSQDDSSSSTYQSLPKYAKIGIIVGIVVVVSLALLGCGMCFLDCRRRQKRRKERRANRDAELVILEMEMRNGQTEQQKRAQKGLWDHLKPMSRDGVVEVTPGDAQHAVDSARHDSTVESVRNGGVAGYPPAHMQRDRGSIASSAGGRSALTRSLLNGGVRR